LKEIEGRRDMAQAAEAIREFRAEARFQRVSPQKARLVLNLIKGRSVEDALNTVAFTRKRVAPLVEKVLRSALQNANYLSQERGLDVDVDNLYVKSAIANDGPRMKRIRPAPMGRAFRYQRRMAHIIVTVAEKLDGSKVDLVTRVDGEAEGQTGKKTAGGKTAGSKKTAKKPAAKKHAAKKAAAKKKKK
jgi:large subunit ribosomal protein L22